MQSRRAGLTLIEILVVVVVVGLLIALLLPAVQSSREASRRSVCQANLRQVGAAVALHESARGGLPQIYNGTFLPQPHWALDEFHFHSWRTIILPHLEQSSLLAAMNLSLPATTLANQTGLNVVADVFLCPSTGNTDRTVNHILAWNDGKIPVGEVGTAARSDYDAVGGFQVEPQIGRHSADMRIYRFGVWGEPTYDLSNGASIRYRTARLVDATDGLSNTALVVERAGRPDVYSRGKSPDLFRSRDPWNGPDHHQATWGISTHFVWLLLNLNPQVNESNVRGIYSFHPGGANVGLADGSARFLKDSTSSAILKAMVTRSGAESEQIE